MKDETERISTDEFPDFSYHDSKKDSEENIHSSHLLYHVRNSGKKIVSSTKKILNGVQAKLEKNKLIDKIAEEVSPHDMSSLPQIEQVNRKLYFGGMISVGIVFFMTGIIACYWIYSSTLTQQVLTP